MPARDRRSLRFGVRAADGRASRVWGLTASATESDVYVFLNGIKFMHVSLHRDGRWQVTSTPAPESPMRWMRPAELAPNLTRALQICVPSAALRFPEAAQADPRVRWLSPPDDAEWAVFFNVFLEEPGVDLRTWPGRDSMGTALVGRAERGEGGTACVVAMEGPAPKAEVTVPGARADLIDRLAERGGDPAEGSFGLLLFGESPDGSRWLVEGPVAFGDRILAEVAATRRQGDVDEDAQG